MMYSVRNTEEKQEHSFEDFLISILSLWACWVICTMEFFVELQIKMKKNQLFIAINARLTWLQMSSLIPFILLFFPNNWKYCWGRSFILKTAAAHSHSAACNWAPRPQVNVRCLCHPFWNAVGAAAGNTWLVSLAEQLWTALFRLLTARPLNHDQQLPYERLWSQISAAV